MTQKQHAVRAYRNALFVYKQNPWSYINNHVHFNVGRYLCVWSSAHFTLACKLSLTLVVWIRWYGVLGIFDVAIKHLLEVIACSHQSLTTQSIFLNDFFHFVQVIDQPDYDLHPLYRIFVANSVFSFVYRVRGKNLTYTSFNFLFSTCHHSELYMKIIARMHQMQM